MAQYAGAATQTGFGPSTLTQFADDWRAAKQAERLAMTQLTGAIIAASATMTEAQISTATEVNRMTVRKALGK